MSRLDTLAAEGKAELTSAELQAQIATLKKDIADLTSTVTQYGKAQSEAFKEQARAGVRYAADMGAEKAAYAQDMAARKYAETEDYVRSNPAASVGIAAGIGFLFGLFASRR